MSETVRTDGKLRADACGLDGVWDRELECATASELLQLGRSAWHSQAANLAERSVFYARKFSEAGVDPTRIGLDELRELPFTTKQELRQAQETSFPFGDNVAVPSSSVKRVYQTSGSTGNPNVLALTRKDIEIWTSIGARSYYATGIHPHHSLVTTFGAGPFVAGHTHWTLERIGACTVPVAPGDTERVLAAFRRGLVDTLLATPSFTLYLANLHEQRVLDGRAYGLVHIVTGGEPGGGVPAIRNRIEDVFGVTVSEVMGIGDVCPSLFGECPALAGMHFCGQGYVWPELVDQHTGQPMQIEAGAVGELVYTTLVREAMPLVRFRSGDIVEIQGIGCVCSRTSFRMRTLGRSDDMFIVRGVNVYPTAIQAVVGEFRPRITGRIRVVLTNEAIAVTPPVPVEVEVPNADAGDEALAEAIEEAIRAKLVFRSKVRLVPQQEFGDPGYKTRLLVRRLETREG